MDAFIQAVNNLLLNPSCIGDEIFHMITDIDIKGAITNEYLSQYMGRGEIFRQDQEGWDKNTRIWMFSNKHSAEEFDPFNVSQYNCLGWRLAFNQTGKCAVLGYNQTMWKEEFERANIIVPILQDELTDACRDNEKLALTVAKELFSKVADIFWGERSCTRIEV